MDKEREETMVTAQTRRGRPSAPLFLPRVLQDSRRGPERPQLKLEDCKGNGNMNERERVE